MIKDQVYAKVILSGEHSVLRGGAAVVAPLKSKSLDFEIEEAEDFKITYSDKTAPYEILVEGTIEKALSILNKAKCDLKMKVFLKTIVPLGMGLGGSAAMCVFVSRLMKHAGFIDEKRIFSLSVELENMFHGESSGVDVAGCLSAAPHLYLRGEPLKKINLELENIVFALFDTGESGDTEECIEKVLLLKNESKSLFYELDSHMNEASKGIVEALENDDKKLLCESFEKAGEVFESWGLVTPKMKEIGQILREKGALAVKPTGSGLGGYMLSIWSKGDERKCGENCVEHFVL